MHRSRRRSVVSSSSRALNVDRVGGLLMVVMLALGTVSFAAFSGSAALVRADFHAQYRAAEHARLIIGVDPSFGSAVVDRVSGLPGVAVVEPRALVSGELRTSAGAWVPFELTAVSDLRSWRLGRSVVDAGSPRISAGEILVDRSSVEQLGLRPGDTTAFRDGRGRQANLRVVGLSRQPGRAAWFDGPAFGVTTYDSLASVSLLDGWNQLAVTAADPAWPRGFPGNDPLLRALAEELIGVGLRPGEIELAPDPGDTALDRTLDGIDQVLVAVGGLGMLSGTLLVAGSVHAHLRRQQRQLGVLQALGAGPGLLLRIGMGGALRWVAPGVALGLVAGYVGALVMAAFVDELINVQRETFLVPFEILVAQAVAALTVSGLAVMLVVWRSSRRPAAANLAERGVASARPSAVGRTIASLSRSPIRRMVLRNALRRGLSSVLVVTALGIAGALYLAVTSIGVGLSAIDGAAEADVIGYRIMAWFMGAVAAVIGAIGALGLLTGLSAVAVERRRELGVLAAVGATPARLAALLAGEALATAVLAWVAALMAWPLIAVPLGSQVGEALADVGVSPVYGPEAGALLVVLVGIALAAAVVPAIGVSRIPVARALGYE